MLGSDALSESDGEADGLIDDSVGALFVDIDTAGDPEELTAAFCDVKGALVTLGDDPEIVGAALEVGTRAPEVVEPATLGEVAC